MILIDQKKGPAENPPVPRSVRLRIIDFKFIFDKLDQRLDIETAIQVFTRIGAQEERKE